MKLHYTRAFFIILIVVIFMSLITRWEEMFGPIDSQIVNTQRNEDDVRVNPVKKTFKTGVTDADAPSISINTGMFNNLQISTLNGAIINAELKEYRTSLTENNPMAMLKNTPENEFIAQSNIEINGQKENINFTQEYVKKKKNQVILGLKASVNGLDILRQYTIEDSSYEIHVKQSVRNTTGKILSITFENGIIRQAIPQDHKFNILDVHSYSFEGVGVSTDQRSFQKHSFLDLDKLNERLELSTTRGWAAMIQHYFVSLWVPKNSLHSGNFIVYANKLFENVYSTGIKTYPIILNTNQSIENNTVLYIGPTITKNLEAIVKDLDPNSRPDGLNKLIDYGALSFISVIIFWLMTSVHDVVSNWGISIILVTVMIKILFYPLSSKSYTSMTKIRRLQPRMKNLQNLYKGDRQKLSRKIMEMYKEEKVNPASGCLPMLIQIPVFISLYWVLLESVQLRQAEFLLWIHDLSSKDPYFILPILMGISMFIQQKISPSSADPIQSKVMIIMPIIFTVFFASFPSGLLLYWLTNNIISIIQQWYITNKYTKIYK